MRPLYLIGKQEVVLLSLLQALPLLKAKPVRRVIVAIILQTQTRLSTVRSALHQTVIFCGRTEPLRRAVEVLLSGS